MGSSVRMHAAHLAFGPLPHVHVQEQEQQEQARELLLRQEVTSRFAEFEVTDSCISYSLAEAPV